MKTAYSNSNCRVLVLVGATLLGAVLAQTLACAADAPAAKHPAAPGDAPAAVPAPAAAKPAPPHAAAPKFKGQADLDSAIAAKVAVEDIKDYEKIIQQCERAIKLGLDPENKKFAQKLIASSRIERAMEVSKSLVSPDGFNPDDRTWPQIRKLALADLDLALAYDPDNADGQLLLARLHALPGGDPARATTAVEAAIRLSDDNPLLKSQALVLRGDMTSDKKQRLADYDEAVKLQPDSFTAVRTRGFFHLINNEFPEARSDLDKAAQLEPDHAATHEALGLVLLALKDYRGALEHMTRAVEIAPNDASAHGNRALILGVQGENDKALADIDQAIKLSPDNLEWALLRANILRQAGRRDEAMADVDKLISRRPNLVEAIRVKAQLLAAANKIPQAITELERAAQKAPDDIELSVDLATFYSADKKPRRAISIYDKLLARNPKIASLYRGRGDAYLSVGQQARAIADYEAALKFDPKDSGLLNNLAWVLATSPDAKLRDGKRALQLAKQACDETEYKAAFILSTLAAAYAETGDFKNAIKWSEKSLAVPETADATRESLKKELSEYRSGKPTRELQNEESGDDATTPSKTPQVKPPTKGPKKIGARP